MRITDWSSDVCSSDLLASERGRQTFERIVAGYRDWLALVLDRWSPESHADVRAMLNRFARQLVADLPVSPAWPGGRKSVVWGQGVAGRVDTGGRSFRIKKQDVKESNKHEKKTSYNA